MVDETHSSELQDDPAVYQCKTRFVHCHRDGSGSRFFL